MTSTADQLLLLACMKTTVLPPPRESCLLPMCRVRSRCRIAHLHTLSQ